MRIFPALLGVILFCAQAAAVRGKPGVWPEVRALQIGLSRPLNQLPPHLYEKFTERCRLNFPPDLSGLGLYDVERFLQTARRILPEDRLSELGPSLVRWLEENEKSVQGVRKRQKHERRSQEKIKAYVKRLPIREAVTDFLEKEGEVYALHKGGAKALQKSEDIVTNRKVTDISASGKRFAFVPREGWIRVREKGRKADWKINVRTLLKDRTKFAFAVGKFATEDDLVISISTGGGGSYFFTYNLLTGTHKEVFRSDEPFSTFEVLPDGTFLVLEDTALTKVFTGGGVRALPLERLWMNITETAWPFFAVSSFPVDPSQKIGVRLIDLRTMEDVGDLLQHLPKKGAIAMAFTSDRKKAAFFNSEMDLFIGETTPPFNVRRVANIGGGRQFDVSDVSLHFSPDSNYLVAINPVGEILIFDPTTFRQPVAQLDAGQDLGARTSVRDEGFYFIKKKGVYMADIGVLNEARKTLKTKQGP